MKSPKKHKVYWIGRNLPTEEYDQKWIAGIKARCIITESGCWLWTRFCWMSPHMKPPQRGYAAGAYRGKTLRVHRQMLKIKLGVPLEPGIHACHTCDTPSCCNPDHLYPATNQQNHLDASKRKRLYGQLKTHCDHGHEFTPENTRWQKCGLSKTRQCKECKRIRDRLYGKQQRRASSIAG